MSDTQMSTETGTPQLSTVDFKLEVLTVPVSDVDRAKAFYQRLGWRLDADYATDEGTLQGVVPGVIPDDGPGDGSQASSCQAALGTGAVLVIVDIGATAKEKGSAGKKR